MQITFPPAPADDQFRHFSSLLQTLPGEGRVSDLLQAYGVDNVIFKFASAGPRFTEFYEDFN